VIAKRPFADSPWGKPAPLASEESLHSHVYRGRMGKLHYDFLPGEHAHELALRFTLDSPIHTAIVGTRNPSHLLRNVENAAAGTLPSYQFEEIRARWKEVATANSVGQT
jgi:hypothetical protein